MQQIATSEKTVAASALPISLGSEVTETSQASVVQAQSDAEQAGFKDVLNQAQTQQKTQPDKPIKPQTEAKVEDEQKLEKPSQEKPEQKNSAVRDIARQAEPQAETQSAQTKSADLPEITDAQLDHAEQNVVDGQNTSHSDIAAQSDDEYLAKLDYRGDYSIPEIDLSEWADTGLNDDLDWVAYIEKVSEKERLFAEYTAYAQQSAIEDKKANVVDGINIKLSNDDNTSTSLALNEEIVSPNAQDLALQPNQDKDPLLVPLPGLIDENVIDSQKRVDKDALVLRPDETEVILPSQDKKQDLEALRELASEIVTVVNPKPFKEMGSVESVSDDQTDSSDANVKLMASLLTVSNQQADDGDSAKQNQAVDLAATTLAGNSSAKVAMTGTAVGTTEGVAQGTTQVSAQFTVQASAGEELINQGSAGNTQATMPTVNRTPLVVTQPGLSVDGHTSSKVIALNENQLDAVVENIAAVLPDTADSKAFAQSLRADINAAAAELTAQKSTGREPGINLKSIVEQTASQTPGLDGDTKNALLQQAGTAEKLVEVAQTVFDQVTNQTPVSNNLQPTQLQAGGAQTSVNAAEQSFVAAIDKISSEGATQVAEQTRTQSTNNMLDKPVAIHQPEGQKQMAEKIRWMVGSRVATADIRLDPPELGSMQIRVSVAGDAASVSFVVQSAQARDVLAEAQPRLREMLSEQGIDLGESFVATQDQQQSGEQEDPQGHNGGLFAGQDGDDTATIVEQPISSARSPYNVDAYV